MAEQFSHYFVKTEGFEKIVVSLNLLTKAIWEAMKTKKNFRMILEYDTEALNVNVDFFEETAAASSDDSLPENECGTNIAHMLSDIETDNVISRRYEKVLSNAKVVNVDFSLKEECHEEKELFETLNFIATSAHRFYLDVAEQIKNRLS